MPTPVPRKRPSKDVPGQVYCTPMPPARTRLAVCTWLSPPDGGDGLAVVGGALVGLTLPVHAMPLSAKLAGTGFEAFHVAPKPNEVLAPVPMLAFQAALVTVT